MTIALATESLSSSPMARVQESSYFVILTKPRVALIRQQCRLCRLNGAKEHSDSEVLGLHRTWYEQRDKIAQGGLAALFFWR
jgi:hypothetical protein